MSRIPQERPTRIPSPAATATHSTIDQSRRDLITIENLALADILWILDRSDCYLEFLKSPEPFPQYSVLAGRTVANLFFENSTRTRISFELAEKRLGGTAVGLSASVSSLTKGESLLDTVRVLESMKLDAIVVRHSVSGVPAFLASHLPSHVHMVNAGDGAHEHPTQALLDAAEMRTALGDLKGKRVAIVGDIRHSRVARSNIWLLKKLGALVTLVGPETLLPRFAESVFGVEVKHSVDKSVLECDAIVVLRIQHERLSNGLLPAMEEYQSRYGMTRTRLANSSAFILHPGPINLGIELDSDVAYGNQSLVLRQVKRGVAVRMAVLEWLFAS